MKINNPFNRKEKRDFVPQSLFPASKTTKTSMQIGRATPVYCLDMMQGNKVKIDASQLTRFASLSKPVMNNYEVSFGAYFCPYRAFDDFFTSPYFNKYLEEHTAGVSKISKLLKADAFFDPSRPDSMRVHPQMVNKEILSESRLIGGLADHLGYNTFIPSYMYADFELPGGDMITLTDWFAGHYAPCTYTEINNTIIDGKLLTMLTFDHELFLQSIVTPSTEPVSNLKFSDIMCDTAFKYGNALQVYYAESGEWTLLNECTSMNEVYQTLSGSEYDKYGIVLPNNDLVQLLLDLGCKIGQNTNMTFNGDSRRIIGTTTIDDVMSSYYNQVINFVCARYMNPSFQANCIRYLAYMRIYSDWFLPENFCKADDFRDIIGWAYYENLIGGPTPYTLRYLFGNANPFYTNHSGNTSYTFFKTYLQNCECLPVLWEKNYMTSLLPSRAINGDTRSDFKYSGNGVADTPVGSTIREHYFNRMFQRFKDLVARLGYDSRKNTSALYGFTEDDKSLRSSVCVGTHTFDVQIGDIAQTSQNTASGNLGQFAGYAVSRDRSGSWEWTAGSNGIFMIICYIRPKGVAFMSQVDRSILKSDYYDYLLPQFGGVGYQDVTMRELGSTSNQKIGNAEIYYEYMMVNNEVSGDMRTVCADYNCDRVSTYFSFDSGNNISSLFITPADKCNRVFNDTSEDKDPILAMIYFNGSVTRQLPEHIQLDF